MTDVADRYEGRDPGMTGPPEHAWSITPHDTNDLVRVTRAINVAASGNVRVRTSTNATVTLYVAAGIAFPIRANRVLATGTDATGIVGMA